MKYGETLRQRSIPEWSHYNVDYDVIKRVIKDNTTPGSGKAVSIPGQGNAVERDFERNFYAVLLDENERVNLFVKSKAGEIERRLGHLERQIATLEPADRPYPPGRRAPRRLERFAKIEREVLKTGQEINSLARFVNCQRIAFRKLLKKYKKWTKNDALVSRFMKEVTAAHDSFWNLEVENLFDEYTAVLHIVRAAFKGGSRSNSLATPFLAPNGGPESSGALDPVSSAATSQLRSLVESGDLVGFDGVFSSLPLGAAGGIASYWVHPDSLIELQVLLLQHTRLHAPHQSSLRTPPFSSKASSPTTTLRRQNSEAKMEAFGQLGREDDIGIIVLDDPQRYIHKPGDDSSVAKARAAYVSKAGPAGEARWAFSTDAIITVETPSGASPHVPGDARMTRLKRKCLRNFFNTSKPFTSRSMSSSSLSGIVEGVTHTQVNSETIEEVRRWLSENSSVKPISGIAAKRSRFIGLENNSSRGVWAVLDREIAMKKSAIDDCIENDWVNAARRDAVNFPYAVLQVRHEGLATNSLISVLDASHLTERVNDFSVQKHCIWQCSQPDEKAPPPWLPVLSKDIRKLPEAARKHVRRPSGNVLQSEHSSSQQMSSQQTSNASVTDEFTMASASGKVASSATSLLFSSDVPILKKPRPGKRSGSSPQFSQQKEAENEVRYWSEYDHPEDAEEGDTYYIYVDPNESVQLPGMQAAKSFLQRLRSVFERQPSADEESALLPERARLKSPLADSDSDSSSEDESADEARLRGYGTIQGFGGPSTGGKGCAFLRAIFPAPNELKQSRPVQIESEELAATRQVFGREGEVTKLRLYITSMGASVVILFTIMMLKTTGRKKLRPEVDAGILFGICANLVFAFISVGYMLSRQDPLSWWHRGIVFSILAMVCVLDGMLAASMFL